MKMPGITELNRTTNRSTQSNLSMATGYIRAIHHPATCFQHGHTPELGYEATRAKELSTGLDSPSTQPKMLRTQPSLLLQIFQASQPSLNHRAEFSSLLCTLVENHLSPSVDCPLVKPGIIVFQM